LFNDDEGGPMGASGFTGKDVNLRSGFGSAWRETGKRIFVLFAHLP